MSTQLLLGILAGTLNIVAFIPIFYAVKHKHLRPHRTTWFIWSATYTILFVQQISEHTGPITIRTAASAIIALYMFLIAIQRQTYGYSVRSALLLVFVTVLCAWASFFANDPLQSKVVLCIISSIALAPLVKRILQNPWSESLTLILANGVASALAFLSLGPHPSIPKLLFPAFILLSTWALIGLVFIKRKYHLQSISYAKIKQKLVAYSSAATPSNTLTQISDDS